MSQLFFSFLFLVLLGSISLEEEHETFGLSKVSLWGNFQCLSHLYQWSENFMRKSLTLLMTFQKNKFCFVIALVYSTQTIQPCTNLSSLMNSIITRSFLIWMNSRGSIDKLWNGSNKKSNNFLFPLKFYATSVYISVQFYIQ